MNSSVPCLGKQNLIRTNKGTLFHLTAGISHCMLTPLRMTAGTALINFASSDSWYHSLHADTLCMTAGTTVINLTSSKSLYHSLYADTIFHDSRYCSDQSYFIWHLVSLTVCWHIVHDSRYCSDQSYFIWQLVSVTLCWHHFALQLIRQCSIFFHSAMTSSATFTQNLKTTKFHLNPLSLL